MESVWILVIRKPLPAKGGVFLMIQGIAFDLEGTIIDLEYLHWQGHLAAAREFGIHMELEEAIKYIPHFVGGPDEAIAEEIAALLNKSNKDQSDFILNRTRYYFIKSLEDIDKIEIRKSFLRIYCSFKDRCLPMTIGSLTTRSIAEILLKKSSLDQYFFPECILLREDVKKVKPDPEIYLKTARRMNILPEQQLVFEDSINGIIAARRANSIPIGIPTLNNNSFMAQMLKAGAFKVYSCWDDVNVEDLFN